MGHIGSKTRSIRQILKKPCVSFKGHIFSPIINVFALMKSQTSSKMGHVGSKTRSLGQILEKPFVRSRGHILSQIIMKLGQNVYLDEHLNGFKIGSC